MGTTASNKLAALVKDQEIEIARLERTETNLCNSIRIARVRLEQAMRFLQYSDNLVHKALARAIDNDLKIINKNYKHALLKDN